MATVGRVRYAGADPYGGGNGGLVGVNPHVERVPLGDRRPARRPVRPAGVRIAARVLPSPQPEGHVVGAYAARAPHMLPVARALLAARAPERAAAGVALRDALPDLWDALA